MSLPKIVALLVAVYVTLALVAIVDTAHALTVTLCSLAGSALASAVVVVAEARRQKGRTR